MQTSVAPRSHASVRGAAISSSADRRAGRAGSRSACPSRRRRTGIEVADVRVVDVAVDDVGDDVAAAVAPQRVGRRADRREVVAARLEQTNDVLLRRAPRPAAARSRIGARSLLTTAARSQSSARRRQRLHPCPATSRRLRGQPSASIRCSSAVRKPGSSQRWPARA